MWDSLFVAVTLAGVWYGWRSGKRLPWLLAGLSLGVGQYFYVSIRVLPLLLLIWGAGLWWRQPEAWRARLSDFLLSGYTAVLAILPLSIYYAGNWAEFQAPLVRVTILGERLANMASAEQLSQPIIVMRQMGQTALGFTYLPLRLLYDPGVPLLLPLAGALFLTGLAWLLLRFNSRAALLLLPLLSVILLGGFSQDPPASQRFILALPSVAVLVALPIGLLGGWLGQMWPDRKILAWGGTAVLLSWLLFIDITFYFGTLYDTYILGGLNTVVATEIAQDLQQEPEKPDVFFLGFPRMGYYSLSTIPYLVPEVEAVDLTEPLTAPPAWEIEQTTWVLFLPERLEEFQYVQEAFPNGRYEEVIDDQDRLLYAVYRLEP